MVLKTGRRTTWDEIEVGEVFAWNGCWHILYKDDENKSPIVLAYDKHGGDDEFERLCGIESVETINFGDINATFPYYKLPQSVQRLWRED